jgi:NADH:ubiquinone oxidoreductase subunit 6 (subunit J)
MNWIFLIIAVLTVAGAVAAMSLRNLVHCALMLMVALAGVAALYLQLGAQFVGFAQVLIYIGAVAILIVFAILLTRGSEPPSQSLFSPKWVVGVAIAVAVFGVMSGMILSSRMVRGALEPPPEATVHQIGDQLMGRFILPLEVIGLLLTAALIGAVLIAMREKEGKSA